MPGTPNRAHRGRGAQAYGQWGAWLGQIRLGRVWVAVIAGG